MRRKNSRNTRNLSPAEKTKLEPPKKSPRRSSRRRQRSSSQTSESSNEEHPDAKDSVQIYGQESADIKPDSILDDKGDLIKSIYASDKEHQDETSIKSPKTNEKEIAEQEEKDKDSEEQNEEIEDMEVKNKGKSKGKNMSNFEQSSNNIELETENENVQGTPQSPSNDNADNENVVQNVNDTSNINMKSQDSSKVEDNAESEDQQDIIEAGFVSEYAEINESNQRNEIVEAENENQQSKYKRDSIRNNYKSSEEEEKSTTPERKSSSEDASRNKTKSSEENSKNNSKESGGFGSKKKITLRRSPPQYDVEQVSNSSAQKPNTSSSTEENKTEESKPSKKITLKRHTTDDSNTSEVLLDIKKDRISRSMSEEAEKKRRLSSVSDSKEQEGEEKAKKVHKRIKLIRTQSRDDLEGNEDKNKRTAVRRQMWGRSDWLNKLTSSFYKVDVDSIKIICPSLKFLGESEVNLEPAPKEQKKLEIPHKRRVSYDDDKSEDSDKPEYERQTSEESSGEPKVELNPSIIAINRKISIVDDTASKLRPPPSPAKNPASNVLYITNLVRPFTVKQLKELLERTGNIKEDGFWTDRIKSKCYVQYESVEEAEATRDALHGVHWPIGNGKKLVIDYATMEDLEKAKNPAPVPVHSPEKIPEKENREPVREDSKHSERDREDRRKREVREWDLGKEDRRGRRFSRSRSKSRSRERTRRHSRRSYTPEGYFNSKKHRKAEDSTPQKLMDDLFLKTKATPSVYWQPLSPEEIARKQQLRLVRMEEHKRRIEETRGRVRDNRRPPFRRR